MTCDQVQAWLDADLDGEEEAARRQAIAAHLAACRDCRRAWKGIQALREGLAAATWTSPDAEARDEQILAVLHREGICRADVALEPQRHNEYEAGTYRIGKGRLPASIFSLPRYLVGFNILTRPGPTLWPAVITMSVSFLLTWGSLRWAETRPPAVATSLPTTAAAPRHPPDPELLEKWLNGPTLGALAWLQPVPAPVPTRAAPTRRGSLPRARTRTG
jgi:hypothetical protein